MIRRKRVRRQKASRRGFQLRASAEGKDGQSGLSPERRRYHKANKKQVTLYLDADLLYWFKKPGAGYQTRINRALVEVMWEAEAAGGRK